MTIANELIKTITANARGSARSLQEEVGPSEIGGCRRKVYMKIKGYTPTNPNTIRLPAIMGTAIHTHIYEAFSKQDPLGVRFLLEEEFEAEGIKGHVDMYDKDNCEVVDWKTVKKSNMSYFPSRQQRWQVQLYGWLISKNGHEVKNVTLVAIPRDGDERDIAYHTEPYNEEIALEALEWLQDIRNRTEEPAPEKDVFFCKFYCGFYDSSGMLGCAGRPKSEAEGAVIDDTEISSAAKDYLNAVNKIGELEKVKEAVKAKLEGVHGKTIDGITIAWSSVAGRKMIDEDKVKELLGEVPVRYGKESVRLSVKGE